MLKTFLIIVQILASLGLIATILLQSGKSAGLSGAISGGAEQVFGKKKGMDNLLSKATTILAIAFLGITLLISLI
ncbi:MAG: preprotein translocase subunit SecG [Clostridia bacterium]|nr:preprotein translocase subunit SecG [Clostridia bacterium]